MCRAPRSDWLEGVRSFPSGHSALVFTTNTWAFLYAVHAHSNMIPQSAGLILALPLCALAWCVGGCGGMGVARKGKR